MDDILDAVVGYLTTLGATELPDKVIHACKRVVLDSIGCAYGAIDSPSVEFVLKAASHWHAPGGTHVFGQSATYPPDMAAFVNGTMIRYLDFNDTYISSGGAGHPSDYLAAVIAACEVVGSDGASCIRGLVAAYEVFCRLTDAFALGIGTWDHVYLGAIAAAGGAGVAMNLSPDELANAVAIAAVGNVSLHQLRAGTISAWKGSASGNACRNGLFAALLAAEGMTGPIQPFQGEGGLEEALGRALCVPRFADTLRVYAIEECDFKRYPSGFFSQAVIDGVLELRKKGIQASGLRQLRIWTSPYGVRMMAGDRAKWNPTTRETADHSLPYTAACALVRGGVGVKDFLTEVLDDPLVLDVMRKISVEAIPQSQDSDEAGYAPAILEAWHGDAQSISVSVVRHRGHHLDPFTDEELEEKFRVQLAASTRNPEPNRLVGRIWKLDELTEISALLQG